MYFDLWYRTPVKTLLFALTLAFCFRAGRLQSAEVRIKHTETILRYETRDQFEILGDVVFIDNHHAVTAGVLGLGRHLQVFDIRDGRSIKTIPHQAVEIHDMDASPDGRYVSATGDHGEVIIWNVKDWSVHSEHSQHVATAVKFIPESSLLASGGYGADATEEIVLWDTSTKTVHHRFKARSTQFHGLAVDATGTLLAQISRDGIVHTWNTNNYSRENRWVDNPIWSTLCLHLSHDSAFLATQNSDRKVKIWNTNKPTPLITLPGTKLIPVAIHGLCNDKYVMLTGGDSTAIIYEVSTWREVHRQKLQSGCDMSSLSPDGDYLLIADSRDITVWKIDIIDNK